MKTSCLFYREVVQTVVLSWSVICHCARDERPRGSAHRIFHRDGVIRSALLFTVPQSLGGGSGLAIGAVDRLRDVLQLD